MSSQIIKLNLIPQGEMPVFYASQFDNGRLINIELYNGTDEYELPSGYTAELHCRKADNNIVTLPASQATENIIRFSSTTQLTACYGNNLCEVSIMDTEDTVIGTLNFILEVEKDPLQGGITSTSEIHNLETQVEEITTEIIGENYYDKSEVDELLADKADAADVYTKTETDTKLALKANAADVYTKAQTDSLLSAKADASSVYTKGQIDTALAAKADASDVYTKSQVDSALALKANTADVYTKTQTDTALATKADKSDTYTKEQVDTIIDNIFPTFTTSGSIANFTTALTKPLVSVTAAAGATTVTRCGINLWDEEWEVGGYSTSTGLPIPYPDRIRSKNPIRVASDTVYNIRCGSTNLMIVNAYDSNGDFIENLVASNVSSDGKTFTTPNNTFYIKFATDATYGTTYNNDISLNYPSTNTAYNAYNGQTVPVADATTLVTQSGVNNVFADSGNITVQYKYMSM